MRITSWEAEWEEEREARTWLVVLRVGSVCSTVANDKYGGGLGGIDPTLRLRPADGKQ